MEDYQKQMMATIGRARRCFTLGEQRHECWAGIRVVDRPNQLPTVSIWPRQLLYFPISVAVPGCGRENDGSYWSEAHEPSFTTLSEATGILVRDYHGRHPGVRPKKSKPERARLFLNELVVVKRFLEHMFKPQGGLQDWLIEGYNTLYQKNWFLIPEGLVIFTKATGNSKPPGIIYGQRLDGTLMCGPSERSLVAQFEVNDLYHTPQQVYLFSLQMARTYSLSKTYQEVVKAHVTDTIHDLQREANTLT